MLPILKLNNQNASSGISVKMRKPDSKPEDQQEAPEKEENSSMAQDAIESCAKDLIRAVHAQDAKGVAEAMQSAFSILESMPHEEAEQYEDNSFKSQNVKAAQESE